VRCVDRLEFELKFSRAHEVLKVMTVQCKKTWVMTVQKNLGHDSAKKNLGSSSRAHVCLFFLCSPSDGLDAGLGLGGGLGAALGASLVHPRLLNSVPLLRLLSD